MAKRHNRRKGNRKRSHMLTYTFAAGLLIATGIVGFACTGDAEDQPQMPGQEDGKHYEGLLDVTLPDGSASQVKEYEGFKLSFNKDNKTPNWVAWELLGEEVDGSEKRQDNF